MYFVVALEMLSFLIYLECYLENSLLMFSISAMK